MIRKFNTRVLKFGARLYTTSGVWSFDVSGTQWTPVGKNAVSVFFSSVSYVLIDFSDGTGFHRYDTKIFGSLNTITFSSTGSATSSAYGAYVYADGKASSYRRTVRYIVPEKAKVVRIDAGNILASFSQTLKINFTEIKNINTLQLTTTGLFDIDSSLLYCKTITTLNFVNAFATGSKYDQGIPIELLTNKSYTGISWRAVLGGVSFSKSNIDKISNVGSTLTSLDLATCSFGDTNGTDGPLPASWNLLVNLQTLNIPQNLWTVLPTVVNSIPSLKTLSIGTVTLTNWGDLSNLVNLTSLTIYLGVNLPNNLPSWFQYLTKLRTFNFTNFSKAPSFGYSTSNVAKLDAFITSLFNFYDLNVAKSGVNTGAIPFRGVTYVSGAGVGGAADSPSGVYQQPAGYVAGATNGSPASSLEMIWLMVNQYGCNFTY